MTSLTLVTVAVIAFGVVSRRGYGRALALAGATPVGAALIAGGTPVPTFYAVAIGAALGLVGRLLARTRRWERLSHPPAPGVVPLVAFAAWGVLVTLLAPYVFSGLGVLADTGVRRLTPGVLSQSNIAQIAYLVLGVCVVVFLSRSRWAGPEIIGTAAGLPVLLSLWAYLGMYGLPFPLGFFDNSPNFAFIETEVGGAPRFRGIFSEPSALGGACLVAIAYMLSRMQQVEGLRRLGALFVVVIATVLGILSTSATFIVAGALLISVVGVVSVLRFVLRRGPMSLLTFSLLWSASLAAFWYLPVLVNVFEQVLGAKVASSSYTDRSSADTYSYRLVLDTFFVGVGLGSNRPSSFVAGLLSTVGLVGTTLFVTVVWIMVREAYPIPNCRPVVWALAAFLITKAIAGPDLNDTNGLLWMCLGVLAHGVVVARRKGAEPTGRSTSPDVTVSGSRRVPGTAAPSGATKAR